MQEVEQDVVSAFECIKCVIENLKEKRNNCEDIFEKAKTTMTELDIDIKLPRITNKQTKRSNTPGDSPEEYYQRILYIPLTENILEDLRIRFINKKNSSLFLIMQLIPYYIIILSKQATETLIETIIENYNYYLNTNCISLRGEIELWKTKWVNSDNNKGR